jgi:hypothetical protein
MAKHLYGPETKINMRPKFYPFVEPGVNLEVTCLCAKAKAVIYVNKQAGWKLAAQAWFILMCLKKAVLIQKNTKVLRLVSDYQIGNA